MAKFGIFRCVLVCFSVYMMYAINAILCGIFPNIEAEINNKVFQINTIIAGVSFITHKRSVDITAIMIDLLALLQAYSIDLSCYLSCYQDLSGALKLTNFTPG